MKFIPILFFGLSCLFSCTSDAPMASIAIRNPSDLARKEVIEVALNVDGEKPLQGQLNGRTVPTEFIDENEDGIIEKALVLLELEPGETANLEVVTSDGSANFTKMTQAELSVKQGGAWTEKEYIGGSFVNLDFLRVPDQHTDHTYFVRYEGPGWESDQMAYRFYLDWRNGMDVFGKLKPEPVLQSVGLDGFDSYHELSDWGMDLLKVGKTLGLGSIGKFRNDTLHRFRVVDSVTCQIVKNGLLESAISTNYYGWADGGSRTDLMSAISIQAASALTTHSIRFTNPIEGFCTGLVKNVGEEYVNEVVDNYHIFATYGKFSLNDDKLGLAVIVETPSISQVVDGAGSHVVLFNPSEEVTYHFMAVWEKGTNPIQSMDSFMALLRQEVLRLNQPLQVLAVD